MDYISNSSHNLSSLYVVNVDGYSNCRGDRLSDKAVQELLDSIMESLLLHLIRRHFRWLIDSLTLSSAG
jgi:hypothetical protein